MYISCSSSGHLNNSSNLKRVILKKMVKFKASELRYLDLASDKIACLCLVNAGNTMPYLLVSLKRKWTRKCNLK